jgi:hypothetical protein
VKVGKNDVTRGVTTVYFTSNKVIQTVAIDDLYPTDDWYETFPGHLTAAWFSSVTP